MDDGMAHIDRCAVPLEREFDNLDRPIDAGAKAPGSRQIDGQLGAIAYASVRFRHARHFCARERVKGGKSASSRTLWRLPSTDRLAPIAGARQPAKPRQ